MIEYQTLTQVTGPLIFLEGIKNVGYGEIVEIETDGERRRGQILELNRDKAIIEVFEGTRGMDVKKTKVRFTGKTMSLGVSKDMVGSVFSGLGEPLKGRIVAEEELDIQGKPINPSAREYPKEFIETGISSIDLMNSLVRGQKLPIFSGVGLPHTELITQIAKQARLLTGEDFLIVFAGMGIGYDEARYFREEFEKTGALERIVLFLNTATDPAIERLATPRVALTAAEHFAWNLDYHVLVVLTDMTSYCNSLREVSSAKEEIPSRRGYPSYLYTDLATIYERSGRITGKKGSITMVPVLTMPEDDITHPIPDLTGYITEGQVLLSRDLFRKGVYPPVDLLSSLSRLMSKGVGRGLTRDDHKSMSNQCYANLAEVEKLRALISIIGEEGLTETDKRYLEWANRFEREFINQDENERRGIKQSLEKAWELLSIIPEERLKRIEKDLMKRYMRGE
ncbi:MAG: V-type ATP synthase subunit B [Candidatus Aenigmarchaeota archaeon]|nr:V-type ATP synthase subunit B [Candidatus Aenigmarchaeota archaeon]NIP39968.1 V-type ATP synthase subunit B [Candidatus Aenigmarchaeota archaeon]NIQ17687.1 V-type ATP synthase subunit B [Candidatus Aenigmarchaeota archaeon]NIS72875.1 V-type ATP synthase subunit B [Candidatus Aenigmarchaeota archaeon]